MAIRSRTLLGGNCASVTAARASVKGVTVAPANSAAPKSRHFDLMRTPQSRHPAQSVSRTRRLASILLQHDSQLTQPILDKIARADREVTNSEDERNDRDQNADRHGLLEQSPNPSSVAQCSGRKDH